MTSPHVIDLVYGDGDPPPEWYVRGHFEPGTPEAEVAMDAVREYWLADHDDEGEPPTLRIGVRCWARWGLPHDDSHSRGFYLRDKPGRGSFPITIVLDQDYIEHEQHLQQRQLERCAEIEAYIRAWLPEATDIRAHGYPADKGTAEFRLPEMAHPVSFNFEAPGSIWVTLDDVPAWERLYRGRRAKSNLCNQPDPQRITPGGERG